MPIILRIWMFGIALLHTLMAVFRYIIKYELAIPYIQWAGLGLVAATLIYMIINLCSSKQTRGKLEGKIKELISPEQVLLIGILLWYVLSCYINQKIRTVSYFKKEDWYLFDAFVCFCILFPMPMILGQKKRKEWIELLIHVVVILYTAVTVICLWHIFHLEVIDLPSGEQAGMTAYSQLMLGEHYNLTGMIAVTMLCLCVYMILTQETAIKILYVFLGLIQLTVVYLSNSRTVFIGMMAFVVVVGFFLPWNHLKGKRVPIRIGISIAVCIAVTLFFWYGRTGTFVLFDKITHYNASLAGEIAATGTPYGVKPIAYRNSGFHAAALAASGADNVRELNNLSNRTEVWKAAWKVMTFNPRYFFFGVTPTTVPAAIEVIGGYEVETVAHAHNILLQLGVGLGFPAMLMFAVFLVCIAVRCVRILIGISGKEMKNTYVIPASLLCFIIIDMAEVYLITRFSAMACFFFLFCGWVVAIDSNRNQGRERPEVQV